MSWIVKQGGFFQLRNHLKNQGIHTWMDTKEERKMSHDQTKILFLMKRKTGIIIIHRYFPYFSG